VSVPFDDTLSLPVLLAWLRLQGGKILLGGVVFALLAFPFVMFKPKVYESASTLLVFPPTFKDAAKAPTPRDSGVQAGHIAEMMPRTLPVELYKALAMSPPVLDEVIRTVPLETGVRGLQTRLGVELVQMGSRGSQGVVYTQALILNAKGGSPELAARTAQVWAEVFKAQVDALSAKGVGETFLLLDALHENTRTELDAADLALSEHKKAFNLELIQAKIAAKQGQLTSFEEKLKQTEVDLAAGEVKLAVLEEELAKESAKNVFFRAPSDDAYWIGGLQNGGAPGVTPERGLRTEEANENYVELRSLGVRAREEVEGLKATGAALGATLAELGDELEGLTAVLADRTVEREKLSREAQSLKSSYEVVRGEYEKGRMADRTQASDIVIAGEAVAPDGPSGRGTPALVVMAALAGMVLMGGFLAVKELSEMAPDRGPASGYRLQASGREAGASPVAAEEEAVRL
jgi:hypothetical protein